MALLAFTPGPLAAQPGGSAPEEIRYSTLVAPPFAHTLGIHRARSSHLRLFLGDRTRFDDPQGVAAVKFASDDDPDARTDDYKLTHDDSNVPKHYGWKTESHLEEIEKAFAAAKAKAPAPLPPEPKDMPSLEQIVRSLDAEGRWMSTAGEPQMLVGQPKFKPGEQYLSSAVFARNLEALSEHVAKRAR